MGKANTASKNSAKAPWMDPPEVREARLRQPVVAFSDFPPSEPRERPKRVAAPPKKVIPDELP
jgi:hypothetical protein